VNVPPRYAAWLDDLCLSSSIPDEQLTAHLAVMTAAEQRIVDEVVGLQDSLMKRHSHDTASVDSCLVNDGSVEMEARWVVDRLRRRGELALLAMDSLERAGWEQTLLTSDAFTAERLLVRLGVTSLTEIEHGPSFDQLDALDDVCDQALELLGHLPVGGFDHWI
jgi:hypothetical protein